MEIPTPSKSKASVKLSNGSFDPNISSLTTRGNEALVLAYCVFQVDPAAIPIGDPSFMVGYLKQMAIQSVFKNPLHEPNVKASCFKYSFHIGQTNLEVDHERALRRSALRLMGSLEPKSVRAAWHPDLVCQVKTIEELGMWQTPDNCMTNFLPLGEEAFLRTLILEPPFEVDPMFTSLLGISDAVWDLQSNLQYLKFPRMEIESYIKATDFLVIASNCPSRGF
ncbi:hypothetical protein HDU76_007207 [Blyttiomyces sp. JEL0837]|nr:hypothetical protein HDU76_007207 [Blyttiomyces sp. JEL0837]